MRCEWEVRFKRMKRGGCMGREVEGVSGRLYKGDFGLVVKVIWVIVD